MMEGEGVHGAALVARTSSIFGVVGAAMQLSWPKQAGCRQAGQAGKAGNEWDAFLARKMHGRQGNRAARDARATARATSATVRGGDG